MLGLVRPGLRLRLFLLVLIALSPFIAVRFWDIRSDSERVTEVAYRHAADLARLIAGNHQEMILKARTLLAVAAQVPAIAEGRPGECHAMLKRIDADTPWQSALWVVAPSGQALCGSLNPQLDLNIADRPYFQQALATRNFVVSDYVQTRVQRRKSLIGAMPVLDDDGDVRAVVVSTIVLDTLAVPIRALANQRDAFLLVDRRGTALVWEPGQPVPTADAAATEAMTGSDLSRLALVRMMLEGTRERIEAEGPDGVRRLWSMRRDPDSGAFAAVGVPSHLVTQYIGRAVAGSLIASAMAALLAALFAWLGGEVWLMRPLTALRAAARRIGKGDLDTPVVLARRSGELRAVAAAMNDMMGNLKERDAELASNTEILERTLEHMDQGLLMFDADKRVRVWNRRLIELLDLPEELLRRRPTTQEVRDWQFAAGEFDHIGEDLREWIRAGDTPGRLAYERERPNGTVLEVRTVQLPNGGGVRTFTDITERKTVERRIARIAREDALTGLPNRLLLRERLAEAFARGRRHGGQIAMLCLDLDRFKLVNDTMGHPVGDELLREVSARIRATVREEDVVARLGGDEFAIIQLGDLQPQSADGLAQRLIEAIDRPFRIGERAINVGASIGIALSPQDAETPEDLFKNADLALYKAKNEGRNLHRFFEPGMDAAMRARQALESDLRLALEREEFELHYQPIVHLERNAISGFEALIRWRHPERGLVLPSAFIACAEETRLIGPIGRWVLRTACAQAMTWPRDLRLAVNVSAVQLACENFVTNVIAAMAETGLSPHRLEIEITETALLQEDPRLLELLEQLRQLGVRIAMDDFGTGYSSLGYVRRFNFDKIKIDRSFVQDIGTSDAAAIIRAVVHMCDRLDIDVTAEGVETAQQLDLVRQEGCTEVQGYYFSPPVRAQEIETLLAKPLRAAA